MLVQLGYPTSGPVRRDRLPFRTTNGTTPIISEPTAVTDSTSTATSGAGSDDGEPPGLMSVGRRPTVAPGS
jgi:hypothetical protein